MSIIIMVLSTSCLFVSKCHSAGQDDASNRPLSRPFSFGAGCGEALRVCVDVPARCEAEGRDSELHEEISMKLQMSLKLFSQIDQIVLAIGVLTSIKTSSLSQRFLFGSVSLPGPRLASFPASGAAAAADDVSRFVDSLIHKILSIFFYLGFMLVQISQAV